jgi:hypothetical protein
MSVKNSSLSHQHDFFKIRNAIRKYLEKKLCSLKKNFNESNPEILRCECELNRVVEDELREEILKMRRFEDLNNEKISPYFLSLAKRPHNSKSLVDLNRDKGTPFDSKTDRDRHIKDYFVDTYKCLPDTVTDKPIKAFLGNVAQHPGVIGSKLSDTE